jgi:hypothetical protein
MKRSHTILRQSALSANIEASLKASILQNL